MIFLRVNDDRAYLLDEILDLIESRPWLGIDLAFYGDLNFSSAQRLRLSGLCGTKKSFHLNHECYTAQDLILNSSHGALRGFSRDVSLAHKFNLTNAVLHWAYDLKNRMPSIRQMQDVLSIFEQAEIVPHIENLAWDFDSHEELINTAILSQMEFGVCFDIGHAKLWGGKPFSVWLDWLTLLDNMGISLTFHIHGNYGERDNHLPLFTCDEGGDFAPRGMTWVFQSLLQTFPKSSFVLETKTESAILNARWIEEKFLADVER